MSHPEEPTPGTGPADAEQGGAGRAGWAGDSSDRTESLPRTAGERSSAEQEPAPPTASAPVRGVTPESGIPAGPDESGTTPPDQPDTTAAFAAAQPPPPGAPAGHYVFVPAGETIRTRRRFGPAVRGLARNRAAQLVAAVVIGAVIGGGTVAIVDNATHPNPPARTFFQPDHRGPFSFGGQPGFRSYGQGTGT